MHETLIAISFCFIIYFSIKAFAALSGKNEPLLISWGCSAFMAFNWFITLWRN